MKTLHGGSLLALLLLSAPSLHAYQAKPQPKPPTQSPGAKGTNQLKGEYGNPSVYYTVGKSTALNYALLGGGIHPAASPAAFAGREGANEAHPAA